MTCDEVQNLICQAATGNVERGAWQRVTDHLQEGCTQCAEQVVAAQRSVDWLVLAETPVDVTADQRQRMLAKIQSADQPLGHRSTLPIAAPATPTTQPTRRMLVAATVLIGLGAAVWWGATRFAAVQSAKPPASFGELDERLAEANRHLAQAVLHFAALGDGPLATGVSAQLIVDQATRECHVYALDLPPLEGDRVYRLWLLTGDEGADPTWHALDDFSIAGDGVGSVLCELPPADGAPRHMVISAEPQSESTTPQGPLLFKSDRLP